MTDEKTLFEALRGALVADLRETSGAGADAAALVAPARLREALLLLRDRFGFNLLVDLTAVDRFRFPYSNPTGVTDPCQATQGTAWRPKEMRQDRFELTYRLLALEPGDGALLGRFAVKCRVSEGEPGPHSIRDLWPCADWLEREVWDMFGVTYRDRPKLDRILLYPEFVGHPLRKDYPIKRRQPLLTPRVAPAGRIADGDLRPKLA